MSKVRYVYQLSLADGKVLIHESDGLFSGKGEQSEETPVLINSAVLIKILEMPEEQSEVLEVEVVSE